MIRSFFFHLMLLVALPFFWTAEPQPVQATVPAVTDEVWQLNWFVACLNRVGLEYSAEEDDRLRDRVLNYTLWLLETRPESYYWVYDSKTGVLEKFDPMTGTLCLSSLCRDAGTLRLFPLEAQIVWDMYKVPYDHRQYSTAWVLLKAQTEYCVAREPGRFRLWILATEEQLRNEYPGIFRHEPEIRDRTEE